MKSRKIQGNTIQSDNVAPISLKLAQNLGIKVSESKELLKAIVHQTDGNVEDKIDNIDLIIAVSLYAKMEDRNSDPKINQLKLLLKNKNKKAINLGRLWMENKITFEYLLTCLST